jgi:heterodisulfide reductase subunit B
VNYLAKVDEYKMFQGCVIGNRIPFLEASARKVFDKLGIKTSEGPFGCCPDPVGFNSTDHLSWLTLAARNLTIAEQEGKDIISVCNGCFQTLKLANEELKHDDHKREKINKILKKINREFKGNIDVKHFVEVLYDIGEERIKENVVRDLSSLKVACHAGCHYMRPSHVIQTDDPMKPIKLRYLVNAVGATPVDYSDEIICCGAGVEHAEEGPAMQILSNKFKSASAAGAEAIIVNCPACFQQFDTNVRKVENLSGVKYSMPILYITELLALAFGFNPDDLGVKFHRVRLKAFLEKYNLKQD